MAILNLQSTSGGSLVSISRVQKAGSRDYRPGRDLGRIKGPSETVAAREGSPS